MKEKTNKRFDDFPAAILYLDDLKEIIKSVSQSGEKIEITCGNIELESVDEIDELAQRQHGKRFESIYLKSYRPHMTVDLRPYGVSVYIENDSPPLRGAIHKINEIVSSRKRKYFDALHNTPTLLLMLGAFINFTQGNNTVAWTYVGLAFASVFVVVSIQMKHKLIIHPYPKHEKTSFFTRRKDELILAMFSATFGALLMLVLSWYFP